KEHMVNGKTHHDFLFGHASGQNKNLGTVQGSLFVLVKLSEAFLPRQTNRQRATRGDSPILGTK
ncbi:hypothetical protein, partial [Vibrio parahaemolyticus]|uniref:hypothetical protein n=1 Tax=Vibrio parahaemolyticus TaxID=670 RepID=UPI001D163770